MTSSARLTHSAPILLVRDIHATAAYFRDALGFRLGELYGDPPGFVIAARDQMHIMLKQAADPGDVVPMTNRSPGLWDAYFWTDDVDALHREVTEAGAVIDYGPCDQPYGCREFGVRDPDGHDIGFGQVLRQPPSSEGSSPSGIP